MIAATGRPTAMNPNPIQSSRPFVGLYRLRTTIVIAVSQKTTSQIDKRRKTYYSWRIRSKSTIAAVPPSNKTCEIMETDAPR
jgi:hypothetical protein